MHPTDPNTAYVGLSGFGTGHVWMTTNGGLGWTSVSGLLPDAPVNTTVFDPQGRLLVGTDQGVFGSIDGGTTWLSLNAGLPSVPISDLVSNAAGTQLFVFTYGRGAYTIRLDNAAIPTATPTATVVTAPTCGSFSSTTGAPVGTPTPVLGAGSEVGPAPSGGLPPLTRGEPPRVMGRAIHAIPAPEKGSMQPAGGPDWATIACETFEGNWPTGAWSTGNGSPSPAGFDVCWATSPFQPYPGSTRSAWHDRGCTNGTDPAVSPFYSASNDAYMVYGPFSLVGATAAEVHFRLWRQIAGSIVGGVAQGDYLFVGAFTPDSDAFGVTYTGSSTSAEPPTSQGWVGTTFDLADVFSLGSLLGKPEVYVVFEFISDGGTSVTSRDNGAFIDDVLIHKQIAVAASTPTATPGTPTATRTAAPTTTTTPTPGAIAGRDFTLQSGPAAAAGVGGSALQSRVLTWRPGTQTPSLLLRWSAEHGFTFPGVLLAGAGTFTDSDAITDSTYCYLLVAYLGGLANINVQAFSDFLCVYPDSNRGPTPPGQFRIRLNDSPTVTLEWTPPGPQTRYELTTTYFDRASPPVRQLAGNVTQFSETAPAAVCYRLVAFSGAIELGATDTLCAVPGLSSFGTAMISETGLGLESLQRMPGARISLPPP